MKFRRATGKRIGSGGIDDPEFRILLIGEVIDADKGLQPLPGLGELCIEV